jgi:hypothetical protein
MTLWSLIKGHLGLGCVLSIVQVSKGHEIMPKSPIIRKNVAFVNKE